MQNQGLLQMLGQGFTPPPNSGVGIRPGPGPGFRLPPDAQFGQFPGMQQGQNQMDLKTLLMLLERQRQQNPYALSNGMQPMQQLPGGLLGGIK